MGHSILVLIPYFGSWPEWASLFFETVRRNESIDFLVVTDSPLPGAVPANVQVREMSFRGYVDYLNQHIEITVAPPNPYKLCDFRPLFGYIHRQDFQGYDFYGWCDVDLLFGDIRQFFTHDILACHEVLSTHRHRISGHFAIFRNTSRNREMFRKIYRWKEALRNPEFVGIDEHGITNAYLMTMVDRLNEKFGWSLDNLVTRAMSHRRRRGLFLEEAYTTPFLPRPWLDGTLNSDQPAVWYYRDGQITNCRDGDRAFIYLHLMNFKSSQWRHDGTPAPWEGVDRICKATVEDMTEGIVIDESGIRPLRSGAP